MALQTLVSADGNTPAIDGWFEKVRPLTPREKELIAQSAAARSSENERKVLGVKKWVGDMSWQETLERGAAMPTFNIEGLVAGYTGPGGKTILPGRAVAKLDLRLAPNQGRLRRQAEGPPRRARLPEPGAHRVATGRGHLYFFRCWARGKESLTT